MSTTTLLMVDTTGCDMNETEDEPDAAGGSNSNNNNNNNNNSSSNSRKFGGGGFASSKYVAPLPTRTRCVVVILCLATTNDARTAPHSLSQPLAQLNPKNACARLCVWICVQGLISGKHSWSWSMCGAC